MALSGSSVSEDTSVLRDPDVGDPRRLPILFIDSHEDNSAVLDMLKRADYPFMRQHAVGSGMPELMVGHELHSGIAAIGEYLERYLQSRRSPEAT